MQLFLSLKYLYFATINVQNYTKTWGLGRPLEFN